MAPGTNKQAFGGIDALRFCAAVSVALFHYCFWVWAFPQGIAGRAAGVAPQADLGNLFSWGWVGVEVFFVISGFVIAFSAESSSPTKFALARVKRLVPAVLVCAPITAATLYAVHILSAESATRLTLRTIAFIPSSPWIDSVYWTLGIEIFFYALIWALLLMGKIRWLENSAIAVGLVSTAFWLLFFPLGLERFAETRILDLFLVHHGCFFAIGVLLWAMRTKGVNGKRVALAILFNVVGLLQIISASNAIAGKVGSPLPVSAPILIYLIAIALVTASLWTRLPWSGWRKIGLATYPLYLIHNAVGAALIGKLQEIGVAYFASALITLLLSVVFSCLVAWHLEPVLRTWFDSLPFMPQRVPSRP
ncbi:MAG TPA: acyltransferase [Rhodocyclaceae bacterium]|jgi:peptidoglycan/LPS O-acetylase OafA/YrhL|nr:acyltransferase [Rhodocyclaceae bacterium]